MSTTRLRSVPPVPEDGRHARTARSREAIVVAAMASIRETSRAPELDEVAQRAGISRRTLFRIFEDLGQLHIAINEQLGVELVERYPFPRPQRSLPQTIAAVVDHRDNVYAYIKPIRLVADQIAPARPAISQMQKEASAIFRSHLRLVFRRFIADDDDATWNALEVATSWSSWLHLKDTQNLSNNKTREAMELAVTRLLKHG